MNICWNLFNERILYSCHAVFSCSAPFSILVVIEPMVGENSLRFRLRSLTLSNHSWYIRLRSGQAEHCTLSSLPAITIHLEVVMWSKHELFWGLFGIIDEEGRHFLLEGASIKKWLWNLGLIPLENIVVVPVALCETWIKSTKNPWTSWLCITRSSLLLF